MYKLIRPILFREDPETAHNMIAVIGKIAGISPARSILRPLYGFDDERLRVRLFGIQFKNPIGLAAGFDKNADMLPFLACAGFGFIEIGTVTPLPQEGNPKPRLFRLEADEALVNRLGFNGKGVEYVRENLRRYRDGLVVGVNIGRNKTTPNDEAESDYGKCFERLSEYAGYMVVNVSSPNTPRLRELQEKKPLAELLNDIQAANFRKASPRPILLKIAPDLTEEQIDDVIAIVEKTGVRGIIATNTTISREGLTSPKKRIRAVGQGGLSGKPLRNRSTEVVRYIFKQSKGRIPIIGVGGVFSAEDAYEKIRAGASLVQVYTGLVYEGPGLIKRINKGLVALLERDGFSSVEDAVGAEHR
ncbi:quinone-dependent dihydroorotate dehydrogenase [Candidatus Parcubacteria bacterium]|nr:MAG: quinone-dependent dihydroorotate dehydrogenase [Candidatus Parcubacteria bacterium]